MNDEETLNLKKYFVTSKNKDKPFCPLIDERVDPFNPNKKKVLKYRN
jgi:hypothetical protein